MIACICTSRWMHYKQLTQLRIPDYRLRIYNEHIAFSVSLFALGQVMKSSATCPFVANYMNGTATKEVSDLTILLAV